MALPTSYQRVTTATNYDAAAGLPYLRFDGVDDSLSTNSINFTSTDKMSVFAGVRKLADGATTNFAPVVELSADTGTQNGSFALIPQGAASFSFKLDYVSRGTIKVDVLTNDAAYSAPVSLCLTGISDISGDRATLRVNGAQVAQNTGDQGTGNYGNYPLYIGRRGGSSLPFNGQLYSMIIVGKQVTAGELTSTETYVNTKTGAY